MSRALRLLAVFGLAAPLAAQTKVSFSSLNAKVQGVRFFPGDADIVPYDERFYMTQFDSATTKFITIELDLDYPKVPNTVTFSLQCEYVGPNSVASPVMNATIQAGWSGSYHAAGWGAKTRGSWAVGDYQVYCRDGQAVVARGSFKVTRDQYEFPEFKGVVTGFRFFEGPNTMPAVDTRKYALEFKNSSTRRIYFELGVDYPAAPSAQKVTVECRYDFPDGRSFPVTVTPSITAGWTGSYHAGGLGYDEPGKWVVGDYDVSCRYEGRLIAKGSFSIE